MVGLALYYEASKEYITPVSFIDMGKATSSSDVTLGSGTTMYLFLLHLCYVAPMESEMKAAQFRKFNFN